MRRLRALVVVIALIGLAAPAFATDVPNGTFEDTTGGTGWVTAIPQWTSNPIPGSGSNRLGVFYSVGSYTAPQGSTFGGLANTGGSAQTLRSGTFTIDNMTLRFKYMYATTTASSSTDPFTVTLMTSGGNTVYTLADGSSSALAVGTITEGPFLNTTEYDTGWRSFSIDVQSLLGQTAQLEFTVGSTGNGSSAGFLDDISQVPEPSTILLFGLGALGLTAYGRRRRRAKRA